MRNRIRKQRLALFSVLVLFIFSYPFITVANKSVFVQGIPVLYLYIFISWILGILLLFLLTRD